MLTKVEPERTKQNFYKDYWNIFDFVTVCGSAIDAFIVEFGGVSTMCDRSGKLNRNWILLTLDFA